MRSRVELFEQIRRDRKFGGLSTHALARKYGGHRRTVRQALESSVPPARKRPEGRPAPRLGEWRGLIDGRLIADRSAPRKQRHTAKPIHQRLREHGVVVSERQVRRYVRERRQQLGELVDELFVPLCSEPGAEAEVDWGEAIVVIAAAPRQISPIKRGSRPNWTTPGPAAGGLVFHLRTWSSIHRRPRVVGRSTIPLRTLSSSRPSSSRRAIRRLARASRRPPLSRACATRHLSDSWGSRPGRMF